MTTKQAPNWRVATMRTSIIGSRLDISQGIISTKASAQTTVAMTMKPEPNQSSSRPRSSTISSAPRKVATRRKPMTSNRPPALGGLVRRQEDGDQRDRGEADRTVDQEAPAPGEIVGKPAAERRADHRRDDHRDAEQGEGLAPLRRRERSRQDRLRDRHHAAAGEALEEAEQEERVEIPRLRAQDRADAEEAEAVEEEGLAPERAREERARREADGVGDQIGRHHPRGFVVADPHAACDIGQHHIGDRGVEHLHEGRKRDQDGDQPGVDRGRAARGRRSAGPSGRVAHTRLHQPSRSRLQPLIEEGDGSTRTVGTTDMPGPSATSVGGLSRMILTGTRWTILT